MTWTFLTAEATEGPGHEASGLRHFRRYVVGPADLGVDFAWGTPVGGVQDVRHGDLPPVKSTRSLC